MDTLKHTENQKRNNAIIITIHSINVITITIILLLRNLVDMPPIGSMLIISMLGYIPIISECIMYKNNALSRRIKYITLFGFFMFYTYLILNADNPIVYTFFIPMVLATSIFNNTNYSVISATLYILDVILAAIVGYKTKQLGYINTDISTLQVIVSVLIVIALVIVTKTIEENHKTQIKNLIETTNKLDYAYNHDLATGLYNRNYLMNIVNKNLDKYDKPVAVTIININGLKLVNDFRGNRTGDKVIIRVGEIIKNITFRFPEHIAIRLDSDEYMIIMPNTNEQEAAKVLESIKKEVSLSKVDGIDVSIEYGISIIHDKTSSLDSSMTFAKNTLYQKKMMNKNSVRSSIIESLRKSLSESDFETEEHAERTKNMAVKLGRALGLSDDEQSKISLLAILHDIGKMAIPHEVLVKPSRLNDEEWEIMKTHTIKGYEIAKSAPELAPIAEGILHHHEKWDGTGYPGGLAGEEIPLLSRIITVIDSHDVMTHDRPYHKAMPAEAAKKELLKCSGTQFDPNIVNVFIDMLDKEENIEKSEGI